MRKSRIIIASDGEIKNNEIEIGEICATWWPWRSRKYGEMRIGEIMRPC